MNKFGMKRTEPKKPIRRVSNKQEKELALRAKLKAELIAEFGEHCMTCGRVGDWRGLSLSHIVPLSRGGKTERSNLLIECYPCHLKFEKRQDLRNAPKQIKQCEACGIRERGALCREAIIPYKDHNICSWCIAKWKKREERDGKSISFKDFIKRNKF